MQNIKNKNGITLIALIVTIIVLLILAGISITMLTGDNGILTQATKAKQETALAEEKERVQLAVTSALLDSDNYNLSTNKLELALQNEFKNNYDSLTGDDGWTFTCRNGNIFYISNNGNVYTSNKIYNYKIYGNTSSLLQKDYLQLEYIESNGKQLIDTGISLNKNSKIEIKYQLLNIENNANSILQTFSSSTSDSFDVTLCGGGTNANTLRFTYGPNYSYYQDFIADTNINKMICDLNNSKLYINNNVSDIYDGPWQNSDTLKLCYRNCKAKIYYLKIYNNNHLVQNLIPCIQTSTNKIGLYNTINNSFFENSGDEAFTPSSTTSFFHQDISVGNNVNDTYQIPLKIITFTNEKDITILLNAPLRKIDNTADYIDLKEKKVIRYISENGIILETPTEETIKIDNLPNFQEIVSIEVNTQIQPSLIESCT